MSLSYHGRSKTFFFFFSDGIDMFQISNLFHRVPRKWSDHQCLCSISYLINQGGPWQWKKTTRLFRIIDNWELEIGVRFSQALDGVMCLRGKKKKKSVSRSLQTCSSLISISHTELPSVEWGKGKSSITKEVLVSLGSWCHCQSFRFLW